MCCAASAGVADSLGGVDRLTSAQRPVLPCRMSASPTWQERLQQSSLTTSTAIYTACILGAACQPDRLMQYGWRMQRTRNCLHLPGLSVPLAVQGVPLAVQGVPLAVQGVLFRPTAQQQQLSVLVGEDQSMRSKQRVAICGIPAFVCTPGQPASG